MTDAPAGRAEIDIRVVWDQGAADREVNRGVDRIESDQGGGGRFRNAGASLGTKLIAGFGAVWAGGAALNIASDLVGDAQAINAGMVMAEQSFGPAIDRVREFGDQVNESFGVSEDRMLSLLGRTGDLLVGLGATEEQAAGLATQSAELAGILALASGGTVDMADASERLEAAMVGETDGLKALGIAISAADIEARLLAKGQGELEGEARRAAEAQAVLELATEQSAGKIESYRDGAFEAAEQQNKLSAAWDTGKVRVGQLLNQGFEKLVAFVVGDVVPMWEELRPTVERVMERIQEVTQSVLEFVQELWSIFGDEVMLVVTFLTEGLIDRITTAFSIVQGIFETVTALLRGEWGEAWGAFAGVVADYVGFIWREVERIFNLVSGFIGEIWSGISSTVGGAVDEIVGFVIGIPDRIGETALGAFSALWDGFRSVVNNIIGAWNNLGFTFPSFSGDWNGPLPGGGFTLGGWELSVAGAGLAIPELAQGGVIDRPTVALIGEDNRTTPEIVSPVDLMASTVRAELQAAGVGGGVHHHHVYIGDEQIEPKMVKVVEGELASLRGGLVGGRR
ncbi:MAG: hypothetical protein AAGA99_21070 [Actinomycetota bacterium]